MRLALPVVALLAVTLAQPAAGAVKVAAPQGLEVVETVEVKAPPAKAWAMLVQPALWWNGQHTFGQDAKGLSIDLKPGGCFCEAIKGGGGVQHMTVVYVAPGKVLRMRGALGPFQGEGVDGAFTATLTPTHEGGTKIAVSYVLGGWLRPGGGEHWAPIVDGMVGEQTTRLARAIDTGSPEPAK